MSEPATARLPRLKIQTRRLVSGWNGIGDQVAFYVKTLGYVGEAVGRYREETLRNIAQMGLGIGALALVGGAVAIVSFVVANAGIVVAVVGYTNLSSIGIEALTGFFAAYVNPRLSSPLLSAFGLAATIGAGATAQLGAMRINEEIDALEVMGIRSIAYLASTRVLAGVVVIIPVFCMATIATMLATRGIVLVAYGQSVGVYDHYFNTFLKTTDFVWAFIQVIAQGFAIMLVHTYYGFNATGGPAGVGEATGRAVRASLVVAIFVTLAVGLALYGRTGNVNLSG